MVLIQRKPNSDTDLDDNIRDRPERRERKSITHNIDYDTIVQTYYWYYDLRGKLKVRDLAPPGEYHGHPRPYVREDIEENIDNNRLTSHLRYYVGKEPKAYTSVVVPRHTLRFLGDVEDAESLYVVKKAVVFFLDGGWMYYKERRKRKVNVKPKRTIKKKLVIKKKIVKRKKR